MGSSGLEGGRGWARPCAGGGVGGRREGGWVMCPGWFPGRCPHPGDCELLPLVTLPLAPRIPHPTPRILERVQIKYETRKEISRDF